jgi:hypothetical protein
LWWSSQNSLRENLLLKLIASLPNHVADLPLRPNIYARTSPRALPQFQETNFKLRMPYLLLSIRTIVFKKWKCQSWLKKGEANAKLGLPTPPVAGS